MAEIIESLSRHKSLAYCADIQQICQPLLQHTPIKEYKIARLYGNGRFFYIASSAQWQDHYIHQRAYQCTPMASDPALFNNRYYLYETCRFASQSVTDQLLLDFNVSHIFCMLDKHEKYCDMHLFAMDKSYDNQVMFYLNNLETLKNFTIYFRDKAKQLLQLFDHKSSLQLRGGSNDAVVQFSNVTHECKQLFLDDIKHFYSSGLAEDKYLTSREHACLQWCAQGKTAEETATILQISRRTVEKHLANIRKKTGCYKQTGLVHALAGH